MSNTCDKGLIIQVSYMFLPLKFSELSSNFYIFSAYIFWVKYGLNLLLSVSITKSTCIQHRYTICNKFFNIQFIIQLIWKSHDPYTQ